MLETLLSNPTVYISPSSPIYVFKFCAASIASLNSFLEVLVPELSLVVLLPVPEYLKVGIPSVIKITMLMASFLLASATFFAIKNPPSVLVPSLKVRSVACSTASFALALFEVYTFLSVKFKPLVQLDDQLSGVPKMRAFACSPYFTTATLTFPLSSFSGVNTPSTKAFAASRVISPNVLLLYFELNILAELSITNITSTFLPESISLPVTDNSIL